MPRWLLYTSLAINVASLGLNVVVARSVLDRPQVARGDGQPVGVPGRFPDSPAASTVAAPSLPSSATERPFQRAWEYQDRATGRRVGVMLSDDAPRLERFSRAAVLSADDDSALRLRFEARRAREMELAREMVQAGAWRPAEFSQLQRAFWESEFRRLPVEKAERIPPEFVPVGPAATH